MAWKRLRWVRKAMGVGTVRGANEAQNRKRPAEVTRSMLLPRCRPQRKPRGINIDPK